MRAREIIKIIEADGWKLRSQKGSHMQFVHSTKKGRVTVPMHGGVDLKKAVVHSILKQAGVK